jgi:LysR family nitrogen assimilation transcriptional regulator
MIDVRKLRYFATVAEVGSFTRAAALLHVAQPALSRQVQQLEDELGHQLLLRSGRQIRLTDAGEAVLRHARTIGRDFERLVEDMQARKGMPMGKVVFGIPPTLAEGIVPGLVAAIKADYPLITLRVVEGLTPVLAEWIRSNEADLAILSLAIPSDAQDYPGLVIEPLASEEMVVAEQAPGPKRCRYDLNQLKSKELVLSGMLAAIVARQLGVGAPSFKYAVEVDSVQAIKTMVLKGQASSILPVSMLINEVKSGLVSASSITARTVHRQIVLAEPSFRQMTQATETLRRVLKQQLEWMSMNGSFSLRHIREHVTERSAVPSRKVSVPKPHRAHKREYLRPQ